VPIFFPPSPLIGLDNVERPFIIAGGISRHFSGLLRKRFIDFDFYRASPPPLPCSPKPGHSGIYARLLVRNASVYQMLLDRRLFNAKQVQAIRVALSAMHAGRVGTKYEGS